MNESEAYEERLKQWEQRFPLLAQERKNEKLLKREDKTKVDE